MQFKTNLYVRTFIRLLAIILLVSINSSCIAPVQLPGKPVWSRGIPVYTYKIVNTFPHDAEAFTQGLVFEEGVLYESTGLHGNSSIRKVNLTTGKVKQIYRLPEQYYGEGITVYKDLIYQLTLDSNKGFVYDKNNFNLLREFNYPNQGWGLTHNGTDLIMSDGSSTLRLLDPETLSVVGQIEVLDNNRPLEMINELEYINGKIYANIWKTDKIAVINPGDGHVIGWVDLSGLLQIGDNTNLIDVLNGIAYDADTDRLFVTGKLWPYLFEIKLIPR
jgi:glutamine cyclotransferase